MIRIVQAAQQMQENHPTVNWLIVAGTAAASWLAPAASLVALVLGCLNIYSWFEKRRRQKKGS